MSAWTIERVEQLAPDAAAVKAAHGLARPAKWVTLGRGEQIVWGECQGSGAQPYQVRSDLDEGAYKCSCPSRKLPCKHTLALLLLVARGTQMPSSTAPAFVVEWTESRAKRAQARTERKPASDKPADPAAQARRIEKRETRIEAGLDRLEAWLDDVMLQGLAAARAQPAAFWTQMAARLVDAQAPGRGATMSHPPRRHPVTDVELGVAVTIHNFRNDWLDVHIFTFDPDGKIALIRSVDGPGTKGTGWPLDKLGK